MSAHISDELPRLLTGEATREETRAAAEHLRGCPDCQQELVSAVVAHASLTSAHRFAADVVAPRRPRQVEDGPSHAAAAEASLPDLSTMFASVRADSTSSHPDRRRARGRWLAGAAAAVVVAGGGVAAGELLGSGSPSPPAAQTVKLAPVGNVRASATATISGGTMRVDATSLPKLNAARQYEVWLVAAGGKRLRPLGYVGDDRTATLPVPRQVMARYADIAISIQRTDQVRFSGDMVVRGRYA